MPSSYTPSLRLTLPADGELVGTWGQVVNNGVTALIEAALAGRLVKALPDADYTLTTSNGAVDEARNAILHFTGTLTATRNVICPAVTKNYLVSNATNQSIVLKTPAGTGVTVPSGARMALTCDGTNVIDAFTRVNATAVNAENLGGVPAASYALNSSLGNYVLKAGDTMTGLLVNTSNIKVGNGAASNSARLMINTLSGTAAGIQLFQDGNESWIIQNSASTTDLSFANSGTERMRLNGVGNLGLGRAPGQMLDIQSNLATIVRIRGGTDSGEGAAYYVSQPNSDTNLLAIGDRASILGGTPGVSASLYTNGVPLLFDVAAVERMRIDTSGNVGIGMSPTSRLSLSGANTNVSIYNTASAGIGSVEYFDDTAVSVAQVWAGGSTYTSFGGVRSLNLKATGALAFFSGGYTERMRIDASGRVGIGVANPDVPLRVDSTGMARGILISGVAGNAATGSQMMLSQSGVDTWAFGQPAGVSAFAIWSGRNPAADGTERMRIDASGRVGIGASSLVQGLEVVGGILARTNSGDPTGPMLDAAGGNGRLRFIASDRTERARVSVEDASGPARLVFSTNDAGAALRERMRIDESGNVGIGVTPAVKLDVSSAAEIAVFRTTTARSSGNGYISFYDPSGRKGYMGYGSSDDTFFIANSLNAGMLFLTNAAERMRIDASGYVMVGAVASAGAGTTRFQVGDTGKTTTGLLVSSASTALSLYAGSLSDSYVTFRSGASLSFGHSPDNLGSFTERAKIDSAGVFTYGGIEIGYRGIPNVSTTGTTAAVGERGKMYVTTGGITLPSATFAAGDTFSIYNNSAAAITITQGASLTLRQAGTTNTGNRTLAARGLVTVSYISASEAIISGAGLT